MTPDQYQILSERLNDLEKRFDKRDRLLTVKPRGKKPRVKRESIVRDFFYVTPRIKK